MLNNLFNTLFNKSTDSVKPMSDTTTNTTPTEMVHKSELDEVKYIILDILCNN